MNLRFHIDPGHGWLQAPHWLIRELNVEDKISAYSYRDADNVYLEEDCDAGRLTDALAAAEIEYNVIFVEHGNDCFIRRLPRHITQ